MCPCGAATGVTVTLAPTRPAATTCGPWTGRSSASGPEPTSRAGGEPNTLPPGRRPAGGVVGEAHDNLAHDNLARSGAGDDAEMQYRPTGA